MDYTFNPNLRAMTGPERSESIAQFLDFGSRTWSTAAEILRIASALHPTPSHAEFANDLADLADGIARHLNTNNQAGYMRALALMTDTELANLLAAAAAVGGE